MPIRISEDPAQLSDVRDAPEKFLVFFSSRNEEGNLWCPVRDLFLVCTSAQTSRKISYTDYLHTLPVTPIHAPTPLLNFKMDEWSKDCRDVEQVIQQAYGSDDSPSALIVYVGQRTECVGVLYNPPWTPDRSHCAF